MASLNEVVTSVLKFTDDEYFAIDEAFLAPRESLLLDMDFMGVAVSAPEKIETKSRGKLPLVMAVRSDGDRGWDIRLRENCILVATDLNDGVVRCAKAFVDEKELRSRGRKEKKPRGPKPSGLALATAQLTELDPRARLEMKWDTGTWALGVINYDRGSNTVIVDLVKDEEARVRPIREVKPEPNPLGAGGLPCYLPTVNTPPSPESGVVFTGEFGGTGDNQSLKIFGAFTVPVRELHLTGKRIIHEFQDGRQERVAAVIPVTLLVVGLDWDKPLQFDWAVPVYGEPLEAGMPGRGYFSLDAFASAGSTELDPGKYACYLVLDGMMYAPKILQIG